jgi:AbrB family looped-hinge helix DNA binding protein
MVYNDAMNASVTIDKAGRIVVPKTVREALHLQAGDALVLESDGQRIVLSPAHEEIRIRREKGLWVFRSGRPAERPAIRTLIDNDREQRISELLGRRT